MKPTFTVVTCNSCKKSNKLCWLNVYNTYPDPSSGSSKIYPVWRCIVCKTLNTNNIDKILSTQK
jgi:hypothetical protein